MYILERDASLMALRMIYSTCSSIDKAPTPSIPIYPFSFFFTISNASVISTLILLVDSIKGSFLKEYRKERIFY